jgi:hypothetical protein
MITRKPNSEYSVKLTIKIGDKIVEQDLEESLSIPSPEKLNLTILSKLMAESASLQARWNYLYNEALCEYEILKRKFDVWNAKKSHEYRKELEQIAKGRVTDKMVEDAIKCDSEYSQLSDEISISKKNMRHVLAIANGFAEKGNKIVSIASLLKFEAENLSGKSSFDQKKYSHIEKTYEQDKENFDINKNDGWPT